jgi:Na+-driven multidrug efflux pump
MTENKIENTWESLSLLRKSALSLFFIMWLAFTAGVIDTFSDTWVLAIISLCVLWLGYIVLAYIITKCFTPV